MSDLEKCSKSPDGKHHADPRSAQQADGCDFTVDYWCEYCGQSGAVTVEERDIQWG